MDLMESQPREVDGGPVDALVLRDRVDPEAKIRRERYPKYVVT